MEGYYSDNEDDDEDDTEESTKSKKKSVLKAGFLGLELKSDKPIKNEEQKREDLLSLLTKKTVEIEDSQELEDDTEMFSVLEEHDIERQIVLDHQAEYQTNIDSETNEPTNKALEAVDIFHDKIISENLDSSSALAETLAEIARSNDSKEQLIGLRVNSLASAAEITEEPVSLRVSAVQPVKQSVNKLDKASESIIQPIFDRVRSFDKQFKRPVSINKENDSTVATLVERLVVKKSESIDSKIPAEIIKKKIEKQVSRIETEITTKELTIKQAAIESINTQPELEDVEVVRSKDPEADRLHSSVAPERIGKVLVKAEAEKSKPRIEMATLKPIDRHIETISRADLLDLSSKTLVDGSTLRKVYETSLITENGLRRVLIEHLRGGDIKRALKRELVEREKDFERDPNIRDKSYELQSSSKQVTKLNLNLEIDNVEQPNQLNKIMNTQININPKNLTKKKVKVSWFDIVLLIFIGVLLTMVLTLVMNRH